MKGVLVPSFTMINGQMRPGWERRCCGNMRRTCENYISRNRYSNAELREIRKTHR